MMESVQAFFFARRGALVAVVALALLWMAQPTAGSVAFGLLLGVAGEALRFWAIGYSRGPTRGLTLDAPVLVTAGPYAHTRNPLYLGNFLNGIGVSLACVGGMLPPAQTRWLALSCLCLLTVYGAIIPYEEKFLEQEFGPAYRQYRDHVPRFWPSRTPRGPRQGAFCLDSALYFERWTLAWFFLIWANLMWRSLG